MIYDTTGSVDSEAFGLAWNATAIPEPGMMAFSWGVLALCLRRRVSRGKDEGGTSGARDRLA